MRSRKIARSFIFLYGAVASAEYLLAGELNAQGFYECGLLAAAMFPFLYFPARLFKGRVKPKHGLDQVLFTWPDGVPFTLRHLLESVAIFGRIGSGKTSSSGKHLARCVVGIPNSSGIIFASNPDDREFWEAIFALFGRSEDLIVFSPTSDKRWNILAKLQERGADALELTQMFVVISECLIESKGKEEIFWKLISERIIENSIRALILAGERITAPNLSSFLATVAYKADQLATDKFKSGYANSVLAKVSGNRDNPADAKYIMDYWYVEFMNLDEKPRSSALSSVANVLHKMSVGMVREIFSTTTNASCDDLLNSKWILMDFPISTHGPSAKLVYSAAKLAVQKQVLKNKYRPGDPITCIFSDECWHFLNTGDREFLSESRKHGGVLIYLTQSVSNYYIALGEDHKADAILGQMGTKIFHSVDVVSADYASRLYGSCLQETYGGSQQAPKDLTDQLLGVGQWSGSVNQGVRPLMEAYEFMHGLKNGGHDHGLQVDSWVFRAGSPNPCIKVTWSQE